MTQLTFDALPLAAPLQRALAGLNYTTPSPIQAQAIPPQLEGRDLIGCAQTGTGKTAAFALPILHHLADERRRPRRCCPRALVLCPTRELAVQVGDSFDKYGKDLPLSCALVYGGVSQQPQVKALRRGVDILVATPGRLLDLIDQGHVDLQELSFLVLDEVDRMLDMGFIHDVRRIAEEMPAQRQTALFTATLTSEVEKVAAQFVNEPVRIIISPQKPAVEKIHQQVCHVKKADKHALLEDFLQEQEDAREMDERTRTLIFSRTKHGADKLSKKLSKAGFKSDAIHGNKSQNARQRALDGFREGRVPVLVATDVAARGIDVKNITLVVNFDLPDAPDTYVHRIGRTARAEAHGRAVTFVEGGELRDFGNIEKFVGREIELHTAHAYHDAEAAHAKPQPKQNGGQRKGRGAKAAHFYTKRQTGGGKRSGRRPNRAARSR